MEVVSARLPVSVWSPGSGVPTPAPQHSFVRRAVEFADTYTSPRPETAGNLGSPSYFQAAFNGAADGFYVFGPLGIMTGAGAAACGIAVHSWTGHQWMGVVAGSLVGSIAGMMVGARTTLGAPTLLGSAVGGALLGAYETLRGDSVARCRDSATITSAFFLPGPAKLAASLGSMVGSHCESTTAKVLVSAAIGTAAGVAVAAAIPGGAGMLAAGIISGLSAAAGPFIGPRQSQLLRNLSADVGKGLQKVGQTMGIVHPGAAPRHSRWSKAAAVLGTIPVSFAREGVHAFFTSDGSLAAVLFGGIKESARQIHIVLTQKDDAGQGAAQPAASVSSPPATAEAVVH